MKVNLGGGDIKIDGYINVDYDPLTNPDYVCDIEKDKLPFEDDTVETIVAHHILEHLGEGFFNAIKEMYRVSKHGTIIDIRVPHPRHWTFLADPTHRRPILPEGLQLFSKKYNKLCKETGAAASRLGYWLDVDFEIISVDEIPDENYLKEFENNTVEYVQKYLKEHNNIILEYHIRMVAIKDYE